jgi:hypothetical protein
MSGETERWWVLPRGGGGERPAFAFSCRDLDYSAPTEEFRGAYEEFLGVVEGDLGGVRTWEGDGPYSSLWFVTLRGVPVVITLDTDELIFHAADPKHDHAVEPLACAILGALRKRGLSPWPGQYDQPPAG